MEKKEIINIEDVIKCYEFLKHLNSLNLNEIEFHKNNEKLDIDQQIVHDWYFFGLNNYDFVLIELLNNLGNKLDD